MSDRIYSVRGAAVSPEPSSDLTATPNVSVTDVRRLRPGRARDGAAAEVKARGDDIARVELENGFVLFSRVDDLIAEHGHSPSTARGAARSDVADDTSVVWELSDLAPTRGALVTPRAERGLLGIGIKVLDLFGVDLKGRAAQDLGRLYETRQLGDSEPGLHRCSLRAELDLAPIDANELDADRGPLLVFIHGTGSSCKGGFGGLWSETNAEGSAVRAQLHDRYEDRVFAFEHRSFTESPIENALTLARSLPARAELHLVTHSRGGLVGELLALSGCERVDEILTPARLDELFRVDRMLAEQVGLSPLDEQERSAHAEKYKDDKARLLELLEELKAKELKIRRFVRVACPARGTTLASGRLDRWLSMLGFVTQLVDRTGIVADGLDFLLAVVKERTDPRTLPGIEAMMPGSAVTRLLHLPDLKTSSDLTVIAGDVEGDSFWQKVKFVAADWFYGADHDLVVNTGSMTGGLARLAGAARFRIDRGADVTHSSYFLNARSVRWLLAGLSRADGDHAGYLPIEAARREEPRWRSAVARSRAAAEPRPLAIVLPGTMGSHLHVDGRHIWLKYLALLRGGLKRLRIDAADVVALDLIDSFYGPLLEFLSRSHRVEVFAYDWRRSILDAAAKLAEALDAWLPAAERENQPVHIVAHSMGGLVVRAMLADPTNGARLWERITRLPNSRFLMLGTPNSGSYEAVRWLTGMNPTQAKLALLDLTRKEDELADLVATYPGLLELLPFGPLAEPLEPRGEPRDFTARALWEDLKERTGAEWNPASAQALRDARAAWKHLERAPVDPRFMCYVAGVQPATVRDYRLAEHRRPSERKRLEFWATEEGDGTVPWASGALPGLPMWYASDTAHDALCASKQWFPAYLDLLRTGTTARLPDSPPLRRRAAGEPGVFPLPVAPPADGIPSEDDLRLFGFGGEWAPPSDERGPVTPTIEVSIRHGDLSYVRHAVLVGHYEGDTIISAEAFLDRKLGYKLSQKLELELYAGPANTHSITIQEDRHAKPAGAIVVGLGPVGALTASTLESGVRNALLAYAVRVAQWPDDRFGKQGAPRSAAVSSLLVGSGAGQLPLQASIEAILRGAIAANERLAAARMDGQVLIDRIEFIEIYEDVAFAACRALQGMLASGALADYVRWTSGEMETGTGGQRRSRYEEEPGWWQRLEIFEEKDRPNTLRFVFSGNRARAEESLAVGQLAHAHALIARASSSVTANKEVAQTLFELLLPLRLKEAAPRQTDLVLMVDESSARYPWELLENRWSDNGRPPAVSAGMVRQLRASDYRAQPAYALSRTALVIGHPDLEGWSDFPDLPGARREANKVVEVLGRSTWSVTESIDEKPVDILGALHRDAWRILHFSGHGCHDYMHPGTGERVSGMVIGSHTFLTPGDVEQMRWVPELVFINCCHLGRTDSKRALDRGALAANLGVQFIRMGVRAVVAAGWAVEDNAALVFAETFYRQMLDGATFGEAVQRAREETWRRFPSINTWGAYQCYGDQSYRLRVDGRRASTRGSGWTSPRELAMELENLAASLNAGTGTGIDDDERGRRGVEDAVAAVRASGRERWLDHAEVSSAIGFVYAEIRDFEAAIEWLDRAIAAKSGECSIRVVEQCASFKVRKAAAAWLSVRGGLDGDQREIERSRYVEAIRTAIHELDLLHRRGATTERLNLLGSACKRLAIVHDAKEPRSEALLNAASYYWEAYAADADSVYAFTNWAAAHLLARYLGCDVPVEREAKLMTGLAELTERLEERYEMNPTFWDGAGLGDLEIVRLLSRSLGPSEPRGGKRAKSTKVKAGGDPKPRWPKDCDAHAAAAEERYRRILHRGASSRQISSVTENLDFVIEILRPSASRLLAALIRVRGSLA